jgi:hypothetical protein
MVKELLIIRPTYLRTYIHAYLHGNHFEHGQGHQRAVNHQGNIRTYIHTRIHTRIHTSTATILNMVRDIKELLLIRPRPPTAYQEKYTLKADCAMREKKRQNAIPEYLLCMYVCTRWKKYTLKADCEGEEETKCYPRVLGVCVCMYVYLGKIYIENGLGEEETKCYSRVLGVYVRTYVCMYALEKYTLKTGWEKKRQNAILEHLVCTYVCMYTFIHTKRTKMNPWDADTVCMRWKNIH